MTGPAFEVWRQPPLASLLAAILLIACAEVGGASMVRFKLDLTRWARSVMLARPVAHGLVGVRDVDEQVIDEALVKFDAGLRLFHLHAEGMGLVIIATTMTAATLVRSDAARRTLIVLFTGIDPLLRHPGGQDGRRVARVDTLRGGGDRGRLVARVAARRAPGAAGMMRLIRSRAPRVRFALLAVAFVATAGEPAAAHHVGAYVPRDNEISANFKQIKFSIQARKFDIALRLFETGAVRAEMRAQAARLPAGLEEATRGALGAGDGPRGERCLMVFFATLIRDLALDADRRLAGTKEAAAARVAAGQKFLEAIWRYYNLVDFAVTQYDPKAAVTVRLAFDEAEGYAQGGKAAGGGSVGPEARGVTARAVTAPDPERMREPLQRIARTLSGLIETSTTAWR